MAGGLYAYFGLASLLSLVLLLSGCGNVFIRANWNGGNQTRTALLNTSPCGDGGVVGFGYRLAPCKAAYGVGHDIDLPEACYYLIDQGRNTLPR